MIKKQCMLAMVAVVLCAGSVGAKNIIPQWVQDRSPVMLSNAAVSFRDKSANATWLTRVAPAIAVVMVLHRMEAAKDNWYKNNPDFLVDADGVALEKWAKVTLAVQSVSYWKEFAATLYKDVTLNNSKFAFGEVMFIAYTIANLYLNR